MAKIDLEKLEKLGNRLAGKTFKEAFPQDELKGTGVGAGFKTKEGVTVTPGILDARRYAALNFQSLVLGYIAKYGEVVVAYRWHKGGFPKFAQFDKGEWKVGEVKSEVFVLKSPPETFRDKPIVSG